MESPRWQTRLRLLMHYKDGIRRELKEHTLRAVNERGREIELFAGNGIALDGFPDPMGEMSQVQVDERALKFSVAAVYFANAGYFRRDIDPDNEGILVRFDENEKHPSYNWLSRGKHAITLVPSAFGSYENLFHALDAETRHAVHHGLLEDQGLSPDNLQKELCWP